MVTKQRFPSGILGTTGSDDVPSVSHAVPRREIELDFVRGLAILMVLDFHAPAHWLSYPLHLLGFPNFGWAGVDVFFVLSGFLVGGLLIKEWRERKQIDGGRFLIRRGFKIWPQYYVFLGMMLLTRHRTVHELRGNLLNIQNYTGGIPHTWSLAVEEHAYLLLVLLLVVAARWKVRMRHLLVFLAITCVSVEVMRMVLSYKGHDVVVATHTRIEGILYGVILAILYHYAPDTFRRLQEHRWLWFAGVAVAIVFFRFQTEALWASSLGWDMSDLLGVALLMLLYRPDPAKRRAKIYRFIAWLGVYSYGIYLWHVSVIAPTMTFASRLPKWMVPIWTGVVPVITAIAGTQTSRSTLPA
jgi:peptidoglycan/LPS O-acetylase OafA/YrhL